MKTPKTPLLAAALAVAFATLAPSAAEACGSYGPPSAEDVATQRVWTVLANRKLDRFVERIDVRLAASGRRGVATIHYLGGRRAPQRVGLALAKGRWVLVRA